MSKYYSKWTFLLIFILVVLLCIGISKGKSLSAKYYSWLYKPLPAVSAGGFSLPGSYYETSIPPGKTDEYLMADYRLWVPNQSGEIRGLIVRQHGCGDPAAATGLDYANDLQWQALARKHNFALLGTKYLTGDKPCEVWALMNYFSKRAFLKALHMFAEKSHRPELETVPWVLWGHSGGADWAAQMMQEYPDRTIAMVTARSGGFQFFGTNPSLIGVPVLFMLGENDPYAYGVNKISQQAFSRYRSINALWSIAIEPNAAHETGNSRFLAIPYLDAVINERLNESENSLRPIATTRGWLGNPVTHEIASAKQYKGNAQQAAWLPNKEVALKWQQYVTKGEITPTQLPSAPTEIHALKQSNNEIVITWNYTPNLEDGLPSFRIYRGNSLVARIKGQNHNFSDAPEPVNFVLQYSDKNGNSKSLYTVEAFNALGKSVSYGAQVAEVK
ncbi:MAG: hypothetical protein ACAF41_00420 (plasmid) [Leptolyngbya sp. BL-A-14]